MAIIKDLAGITGKVLSSLGEPTMQALFWELSAQGVTTNPEEFDIKKFDQEMKKIFGDGADVFMEEIYNELKAHVERQHGHEGNFAEIEGQNLAPIEKIERILSLRVTT